MEKDLGKLKKNETTDIIIRIDDFGGKKGLTIREYVTSDRYTGFTKSGTRISAEAFKEFKNMINSIHEKDLEMTEEEKAAAESKPKPARKPKPKKEEKSKEKEQEKQQEELEQEIAEEVF